MFVSRNIAPVVDEEGELIGLLLVFGDETEQQELARAREDLSRMIVHDLRGPLTAITASMKLLNDLVPADSDFAPIVHRTTEAGMRAVRKLLNLVDSLLDIAKMESGQLQLESVPVQFNAIVDNMALEMESLAQELDVNLEIVLSDDLPLLQVDHEQIERVLINLVDNALKFTPAGGLVRIAAFPPEDHLAGKRYVQIEVSDTGPGIPEEFRERLFNRFTQIGNIQGRRRGTGLGLTFCKLCVESHGGRIWITDNPDGGAVFAFTLPITTEDGVDPSHTAETQEIDGPLL